VVALIILISVLPILIEIVRERRAKKKGLIDGPEPAAAVGVVAAASIAGLLDAAEEHHERHHPDTHGQDMSSRNQSQTYGQPQPQGGTYGQAPQGTYSQPASQGTYGQPTSSGAYGQQAPQGGYGQGAPAGTYGQSQPAPHDAYDEQTGFYGRPPAQEPPSPGTYGQADPRDPYDPHAQYRP
jgi:membrane-associated protein